MDSKKSESKEESDLLWTGEPESKEEPDLLWTREPESKRESDLLWTGEHDTEPGSKGEPDLARHLLGLDVLGRALFDPLRKRAFI